MTTKTVITSWTEEGYKKYGKEFIRTFKEFWPSSVRLVVYFEGTNLREGWTPITQVPKLKEWLGVIAPFSLFQGSLFNQYDIKYDARTNRVIFMQNHALRTIGGKVFWIDGDVITHAKVPETWLDEMLPDDKLCCYLGRGDWYDSETGFIGFNANHPACENFMNVEENVLFTGIVFSLPRYWDMSVFDWTVSCLVAQKPPLKEAFVDLAKDLPRGTMHPFINSRVGECLDHLKGARKGAKSYKSDLIAPRPEPYWQAIWAGDEDTPKLNLMTKSMRTM